MNDAGLPGAERIEAMSSPTQWLAQRQLQESGPSQAVVMSNTAVHGGGGGVGARAGVMRLVVAVWGGLS